MTDNFFTDEEWRQQKDAENATDETREQLVVFKENGKKKTNCT